MSSADRRLAACGCCEPPAGMTPLRVRNRPGLPEIAYRVGTWASFRRSMLDRLPDTSRRLAVEAGTATLPLDDWTSRDGDDYGMALLGLWSVVCDILTFHQERYANDAYLRTATADEAVRRITALLGYRPHPGVAARTSVAFDLADGVGLALPTGLRIQSEPADGERPQVFETAGGLAARDALNRVEVFAPPTAVAPLASGRTGVTLAAGAEAPLPGSRVILWSASAADAREVAEVDRRDGRPVLRWSRPLTRAYTEAAVAGRAFRLAGHAAPATYLSTSPAGGGTFLSFSSEATDTGVSGTSIELDGHVAGLEAGARVLVVGSTGAVVRTVQSVAQGSTELAGQQIASTALGLDGSVTGDRRTTVVHELGAPVEPLPWELAEGVPAGAAEIVVAAPPVTAIERGRRLILDDEAGDPILAAAAADAVGLAPPGGSGAPLWLRITLVAPLPRALGAGAHLLGNVVAADHGETVAAEVLGDGDPKEPFQAFDLAKSPVTAVADPRAPGGAASTVDVRVGGIRWQRRDMLFGAGPSDPVYTLERDTDGGTVVRFGDGRTGARLPSGRGNVAARYRHGIGAEGNLAAGQLSVALDRPTGLDGVHNPLPSQGGVDPESVDEVREGAPAGVRTFDRAVSLTDMADLALDLAGVAKAHATWVWDGEERAVALTVGGSDGLPLPAEGITLLRAFLDQRRDPNRTLKIVGFHPVPLRCEITVEVLADHVTRKVAEAVESALLGALSYERRRFGEQVHLSDAYAVAQGVEGVASCLLTELRERDPADRARHGAGPDPAPPRVVVLGAQPDPAGPSGVRGAELASLGRADLMVHAAGGLPDIEEPA